MLPEEDTLTITEITRKRGRSEVETSVGVMQAVPDVIYFKYCLREGMELTFDKWQTL